MDTRIQRFFLGLLAAFLLVPVASAQDGKVTGTVTDRATGEALPGATVVIEGTTRGAATDADGTFVILNVPPGVYAVRASFVGFGVVTVQEVEVNSGFTTIVDFQLVEGIELEEFVVLGERLIRQDEVSTTTVMRGEEIQALPVDNFQDAISLAAGVVENAGGQDPGIHVRGGRTSEIAYLVDGVLVQDPLSGSLGGFDVARQSIDELQVLTGGFSAKYGKAMSGIILVNTPAGGNEYHGALRLQTDGLSMEGIGQGGPALDYSRPFSNDWGTRSIEGTISGPIIRDRVTFFLNADRLDSDSYLSEFEGPVRPAMLPWSELEGLTFLRSGTTSLIDANGAPVALDLETLGIDEGTVVTAEMIEELREAGVDVDRQAKAAVSDYRQDHQLGLYDDRTRFVANLGIKVTNDIDTRLGYKLTRREWRTYDHGYKYLPQYNDKSQREIDVFSGSITHRVASNMFYELRASYTGNRYYEFLYDESKDEKDAWRFGRLFSPYSVDGAFDTAGLADAEGGNNYDFLGYSEVGIYVDYPYLLSGDLDQPFQLSRNLDLDGDGTVDHFEGDRLTEDLVQEFKELYATLSDEEIEAMGLSKNLIPVLAPPTERDYEERNIKDFQLGLDFTAQVDDRNMLQVGVEFRKMSLFRYLIFANTFWDPQTDPSLESTLTHRPEDEYYVDVKPFEVAAYIEDKIEFGNLVMRPGLRLDVLDPDMATLADYGQVTVMQRPSQPNDPRPETVQAEVKWRISPRFGIAFPLTDRARLSFNYGQFLQYPEYNRLYESYRTAAWVPGEGYVPLDEFGFDLGFESFIGNPNIKPEKTIFYQVDGEFLLSESFKLGASLFYKDIYDYVAVSRTLTQGGQFVWVMDNLDYANSRGFEVRAEKRLEEYLGFSASYTYSRSVGNADDYAGRFDDWYNNSVSGTIPAKKAEPLDWDQPHTLGFMVNGKYSGIKGSLLGRFGSGLPYTPTTTRGLPLGPKNSARRPWTGSIDARVEYRVDLPRYGWITPFFEVTNVLDRKNVLAVYSDTGSPEFTLDPGTQFEDAQRPNLIGPPRHFEVGFTLGF
jgi:outer membrane receptor protein involved in Fe transport